MQKLIKNIMGLDFKNIQKKEDSLFFSRQDYKFILPFSCLESVFNFLKEDFFCRHYGGNCVFKYSNTYFDTKDYKFFNLHRQGKYNRIKIRIRDYKNGVTGTYVECKNKIKGKNTQKERFNISCDNLNPLNHNLIKGNLAKYALILSDLKNKTNISYNRVSFVSKNTLDRVSFDYDVVANNINNSTSIISDYLIMEVKTNKYPKKIVNFLKKNYKIRESNFSKYCVSLCMLNSDVKKNKWKQIIKKYSLKPANVH